MASESESSGSGPLPDSSSSSVDAGSGHLLPISMLLNPNPTEDGATPAPLVVDVSPS